MDSKARAALVDRAKMVDLIAALITLRTQWSPTDRALEIIDTVLAVHAVSEPDADAVERVKAAIRGVLKSAWEDDDEKLIYPCDIDAMAHAAIAAGDDLDAMLDSVHPEATLSLHHISMPMADDPDPYWCAQVRIPITGFVGNRMYEGTGTTRREAVLGAVAKAKEQTNDR